MQARLALSDGKIYYGEGFGACGTRTGEVVFNTAMTGYQEILTDPSYCGQIVTMTYPLIGNYGINPDDFESHRTFVRGFVVREACEYPNNWRAADTLRHYLKESGIVAMSGIDTRSLTRRIRRKGTPLGIITTEDFSDRELAARARELSPLDGAALLDEVTARKTVTMPGEGPRLAVVDLGMKQSIARSLNRAGCEVVVLSARATAEEILDLEPDGLLLSNGPGDPRAAGGMIETVRRLIGRLPIFGICLGHQVIALALGADTYRMKFGHRGSNQPVKDLRTNSVQITTQNHGYAIDEESLEGIAVTVTHRNMNDHTVEGMIHDELPILCVQYHPEAFPGPGDSSGVLQDFMSLMRGTAGRSEGCPGIQT
ncbi:MAG: glutamine-hydrolyzing carbamoyl-phosphate synthase small subunit [Bacillota bacterium]